MSSQGWSLSCCWQHEGGVWFHIGVSRSWVPTVSLGFLWRLDVANRRKVTPIQVRGFLVVTDDHWSLQPS